MPKATDTPTTPDLEMRAVPGIELRAGDGDDEPVIAGYGAVFNSIVDLGLFHKQIAPGAFTDALKGDEDVRSLVNHDPNQRLGRLGNKTLTLVEDDTGLRYEVKPPDTTVGRDTITDIRSGLLDGSSFWFRTRKDTWEESEDEKPLRTLQRVDLFEVGPVTFPAYPETTAAMRSLDAVRAAADENEPPPDLGHLDRDLQLMAAD